MKLKYNHGGEVREIPLTTDKPQGKRLAVRKNGQTWYAPLVSVTDSTASNFRLVFGGEVCALAEAPTLQPEIENILIAPPRVSVMQGQSATAIVSAEGNEAVAGLSYSLTNPPTWITISDDMILIRPSDNDLGEAIVEVIAKDTGSDASASAAFVAESLLRPIIESLSVVPPAVTVAQGSTSTAIVQAVANSAVGGLSYSLDGAPSWVSLDQDTIHIEPTTNDSGTSTVQVVAYDTNSSARADTEFVAEAKMPPEVHDVNWRYGGTVLYCDDCYYVNQGETATFTLYSSYNAAVTGIEYSLEGAPSWATLENNQIHIAPSTSDLGTATITATARDTGSTAQASTQLVIVAQAPPTITRITANNTTMYVNQNHSFATTITAYNQQNEVVPIYSIAHALMPSAVRNVDTNFHQCDTYAYFYYSFRYTTQKFQGAGSTASYYVKEESGSISKHYITYYLYSPTRPSISLQTAQATLATGTSGNQTTYIKATTTQKIAAYWKISGYFPKNSTVTAANTSSTSIASVKVVYPKKEQIRKNASSTVTITCSISSAAYIANTATFQWVSLSSSDAKSDWVGVAL